MPAIHLTLRRSWGPVLTSLLVFGCAHAPPEKTAAPVEAPVVTRELAPVAVTCPEGVPAGARCLRGQDSAQSHYLIVMPEKWSGVLFVHAHGGPFLGAPTTARADEDAKRWAITVREGHAWAASVFRQGGFAVTTAAEDTERVRQIFIAHVATPRRTILHGQSWGAMVATRAAEMYPRSWNGMLLTSGVVAGPATYDFRLDMRVVYQWLCNNHPTPAEAAYPLAIGLPPGSTLTNAALATRVNDCLALNKPAASRTAEQQSKIKTLVDVIRIPESSIISHLNWGTFTLADVARRSGGSPFHNQAVRYQGSSDDVALNAQVLRYAPDTAAIARFAKDVDHAGRFPFPVLTTHGVGDATVFVEGGDTLRARMTAAGHADRLVQTFVQSNEHSYLGDATYPPLFTALLNWVDRGEKPTPVGIDADCKKRSATGCAFLPAYVVKPMASRIAPR
jgi:pimeloyl-ACP methyl ester carboxylesterase